MEKTRVFSSVQVNFPKHISDEIFAWGELSIPDEELFIDIDNMHFGREDEIHVTILYGLHSESPQQVRELITRTKPFEIKLGKIGVFTNNDKFDVVKIEAQSDTLMEINQRLVKHVIFTNKYLVYQPHVTIAYVNKGKGWKHNNVDVFDGKMVLIDHVTFSSRNGQKTYIKLTP
jgi:2'-5' RNA ligase